jgi:hypothetical protein
MPQRLRVEKDLAYYGKQLDMLDAPVHNLPMLARAA